MSVFSCYLNALQGILATMQEDGTLPSDAAVGAVTMEPPRDAAHGDLATNAAMVLAKPARRNPRELAARIAADLSQVDGVTAAEVAGPGFINIRLKPSVWLDEVARVLDPVADYGRSSLGEGERVNVEYVSANPTGPLHVGHVRGAVFGDALAALMAYTGFDVTKEYYINDAGGQVLILAESVFMRYREALGETIEIPDGFYPGDYLIPVGEALKAAHGDTLLGQPKDQWMPVVKAMAIDMMMAMIRDDLAALSIRQDVFFSEASLHAGPEGGRVAQMIASLRAEGLVYDGRIEPPKSLSKEESAEWDDRIQPLFRSSDHGDDTDRPLQKSNGEWTYFASDVAYARDKFERGFRQAIYILGADHGGYVKRLQAVGSAVSGGAMAVDVLLCQLVKLFRAGEPVRMSKRAGNFVTLRDVVDEVGQDVVRFMMLTRKNDAPLDFDFAKVQEQSRDNPVFYVQYAHARICSVLRNAVDVAGGDLSDGALAGADLSLLTNESEIGLAAKLAEFPRIIEQAAVAHEPHRVAFYLYDLASAFHGHWNRGKEDVSLRFLVSGNLPLTVSRLALIRAVARVIAVGLGILGVRPAEEMR